MIETRRAKPSQASCVPIFTTMLLKTAKYFIEQALQTEEGEICLGQGRSKLHCREQLLTARLMVCCWKSKAGAEWQSIISDTNSQYPEYSPLVDAKYAQSYTVPHSEEIPSGVHKLAIVSMQGALLVSAEDQLMYLCNPNNPKEGKFKVHLLVEMAFKLWSSHAPPITAVAVPIAPDAEMQSTISRLQKEKQELEQQGRQP